MKAKYTCNKCNQSFSEDSINAYCSDCDSEIKKAVRYDECLMGQQVLSTGAKLIRLLFILHPEHKLTYNEDLARILSMGVRTIYRCKKELISAGLL